MPQEYSDYDFRGHPQCSGVRVAGVIFDATEPDSEDGDFWLNVVHAAAALSELEQAGISKPFRNLLLIAGLDLETLSKMFFDSLLKDSGISIPGDRVKIFNALCNQPQ